MAIRSGIGIGEAQVFDTSGLANQYAKQVAADQKAQAAQAEIQRKAAEKYNEELADLIANVKTEGARDNDVPDITKAYNDIKDFYAQSAKLKDTDRPLFRAELRNRINSLNEFAQRSNKLSKDVAAMSGEIAKNEWDYDPNSVLELKRINQTPLKQLGADAVIDPMKYKRLPNFKMVEDILDKTYDLGKENAKFVGDVSVKGRTVGVSKVAPEFINAALIQSVQNSPEAKYALKSLYTKTTGDTQPTDEKLGSFLRQQYETRHRYDYEGSPQKIAKAGGGRDSGDTNDDVYAGWLKGAFTKDKESSLKNLSTVAGSKVKITPSKDGITITYKPVTNVGTPQMPYYMESINPKTAVARNAGELAGILRDAGVTGAGSKLISKVGGSARPTKPTIPSRQVESGYKINQILGGYKYIGGPADDKNSWVKVK